MGEIRRLSIEKDGFYLDEQPFRFIAGAVHYFRVPRPYWRDRLLKLKACGFNTVETYTAWNIHEEKEGVFDYSGMKDIAAFLRLAQELGLYAIVRPGPYICSEWDFGAFPWWLMTKPGIRLRCMNDAYLAAVDRYFDSLMQVLTPLQSTKGGPILMMQVENEYGSYGDDTQYLTYLADGMKKRGVDVPLFTSDGPTDFMLTGGTVPGIHKTGNFGARVAEQLDKLREHQPDGPLMCCEYWNGWFDHWLEAHHTRDPQDAADTLDEILAHGASVSAYMFHGGTNFGYLNGANNYNKYEPTVNSYDDDAPVNECGDLTPKYHLFRQVIAKYAPLPQLDVPAVMPKKRYGKVAFTESARLFDNLDALAKPVQCAYPLTMEQLGDGMGFVLYEASVRGPREKLPVILQNAHDRAHIYANDVLQGIFFRNDEKPACELEIPRSGLQLKILVENMGRTNYGYYMLEEKGITQAIRLGQTNVYHWKHYSLPLRTAPQTLAYQKGVPVCDRTPRFLRGTLHVEGAPVDTFIKLPGFARGLIYVNGFLLSRYWSVGPQRSAYLPAPFFHTGDNEIVVFELEGYDQPEAIFDDSFDLG